MLCDVALEKIKKDCPTLFEMPFTKFAFSQGWFSAKMIIMKLVKESLGADAFLKLDEVLDKADKKEAV